MTDISAALEALNPPRELTIRLADLAHLLGWSERTSNRAWRRGDFPPPAFGAGKTARWQKADLMKWLAEEGARHSQARHEGATRG